MNNSKDAELQQIARLRLARVLIDQGKPDEAHQACWRGDARAASPAATTRCAAMRYIAKKDIAGAIAEYKAALAPRDARRRISAVAGIEDCRSRRRPAPCAPSGHSNKAKP